MIPIDTIRVCTRCKESKPISDFQKDRGRKDGIKSYCKRCAVLLKREWTARNLDHKRAYDIAYNKNGSLGMRTIGVSVVRENKDYITSLKLKCDKCGYNKFPEVLQYHHKDSSLKSFNLSNPSVRSREEIDLEISKCLCLCPTCHAEEHLGGKNRRPYPAGRTSPHKI